MLNLGAIFDTFTNQSGYPVITVNRHADKKTLVISQERFWLKKKVPNDETLWEIPINFASSKDNPKFENTKPLFTMSRWSKNMEIDLVNVTDWIVFNVQQTGMINKKEVTNPFPSTLHHIVKALFLFITFIKSILLPIRILNRFT